MEHVTNEQLARLLNDHIEQHDEDTAKILLALYGDEKRKIRGLVEQVEEATDIIVGAKFLGTVGKGVIILGTIFGMIWAIFMAIKTK